LTILALKTLLDDGRSEGMSTNHYEDVESVRSSHHGSHNDPEPIYEPISEYNRL